MKGVIFWVKKRVAPREPARRLVGAFLRLPVFQKQTLAPAATNTVI
jgi:hypothetical protein